MEPRRVLITGTSRGIGADLVRHYLAAGDTVVGCARGESPLEHERYLHVHADITDQSQVGALVRAVRGRCGSLDVLINNAGVASMNPVALTSADAARRIVDTNFFGTFLLTHAALRLLRRSANGRIVNLTTIAVPLRLAGEAIYAASKSAVETFTRIVAREVGAFGITCNAVGPGPIRTHLTSGVPADKIERLIASQSIPRWAESCDVANVIDFFLRPESRLITGQIVYLGGAG
jgi:3-oxoacyl-[acyl-carrier protein] reductase